MSARKAGTVYRAAEDAGLSVSSLLEDSERWLGGEHGFVSDTVRA